MSTIVVIGGGLAGGTVVTSLREGGFEGDIVLFAAEPHAPYERPPLSKDYLMGKKPIEKAYVHDEGWYAAHDVDLRTDTEVVAIDRDAKVVRRYAVCAPEPSARARCRGTAPVAITNWS